MILEELQISQAFLGAAWSGLKSQKGSKSLDQ